MKPSLADQLKEVKLDPSDYDRLPIREDVLVMKNMKTIMPQWEKLNYLQKHLKTLSRYIRKNKGEKLSDWLHANHESLSLIVLKKIGDHDNSTGGISAYFLNLQNFYDEEEEKYDKMEEEGNPPADLDRIIKEMRGARSEKRSNRRKVRKLKWKDLESDGKGYLVLSDEEPTDPAEPAPDSKGDKKDEKTPDQNKPSEEAVATGEVIVKQRKKIGIWIAGTVIAVTGIALLANSGSTSTAK